MTQGFLDDLHGARFYLSFTSASYIPTIKYHANRDKAFC